MPSTGRQCGNQYIREVAPDHYKMFATGKQSKIVAGMLKQAQQSLLTSPEDLQNQYKVHVLLLAIAIMYLWSLSYWSTWVLSIYKCETNSVYYLLLDSLQYLINLAFNSSVE